MNNGGQWSVKWVVGLVLAGLIIFAGQKAMTFESRIQVLENEKSYLVTRLDRLELKIDILNDKINNLHDLGMKKKTIFNDD